MYELCNVWTLSHVKNASVNSVTNELWKRTKNKNMNFVADSFYKVFAIYFLFCSRNEKNYKMQNYFSQVYTSDSPFKYQRQNSSGHKIFRPNDSFGSSDSPFK